MSTYVLAVIIAVSVFVLVIAGFFTIRFFVKNRQKKYKGVYNPSFVRADKDRIKDTEQLRGSGSLKDRPEKQGRSRFYAFGVFIAAIFGTLAVKLWSLQILGHEEYVKLSSENMSSEVVIPANRGRILDRNGNELVGNRPSITVTGKRGLAEDTALLHRLSLVLGVPVGIIRRNLLDDAEGVQSDHTIATDVSMESVAYIREHPSLFKDVNVEARTVRYYPYDSLGAHILGYTGPVTEEFLANQTGDEPIPYRSGDSIGKDGVEYTYERILQGMHGSKTYKVDAAGNPTDIISEVEPVSGDDVVLTIDAGLQRETDRILGEIVTKMRGGSYKNCNAGVIVCIDVKDGGILASSSYPTYLPADLSGGISTELWEQLNTEESGYPLTNRVVSGTYPAASTFKLITSLAGLTNNMIDDNTTYHCDGFWEEYGEEWGQRCWIFPEGHGDMDLEESINQSCDVFFYSVGAAFYEQWRAREENAYDRPNPFQDYIATWGFGSQLGVDMPGEARGRIPEASWKRDTFSDTPEDAVWRPGDMTNMSIGQGDLLVTPLQVCNAYATFARQKAIVPHVFSHVIDSEGNAIVEYVPEEVEVQPQYEQLHHDRVLDGLKRVVARNQNFDALPVICAGKSGTAEVAGKDDYAWFVTYAPADDPQYCVLSVIEQGGSGSLSAVSGVAQTLAYLYGAEATEFAPPQEAERSER